jgi:hypothetical protein
LVPLQARGIKGLGAGVGAGGEKLAPLLDSRGGGEEGLSVACAWSSYPGRPWWRGGDSEIRLCSFFWRLMLAQFMVSPVLPRVPVCHHGGGSRSLCWRLGGVWFVFNWELLSGGLSAAGSAIPPDQRAVGQPLRRCSGSACWIPLLGAPSGASLAAPSQTTRRTGIVLEEEEAGLDGVSALGLGSSLQVCRVSL